MGVKYLITQTSTCQVAELADQFALVKLAPRSKRPVERFWHVREAPNREEVAQWLDDGCGIGLRLGPQPSGDFLIAIDVDSTKGAAWLRDNGGVPVCPTIQSKRGRKYILKLPHGIRLSKIVPTQGIEILGEGHQIVLPTPNAPDDRFWVISLEELNFEIPYPHPWLLKLIRDHNRRARRELPAKSPTVGIRECGGISEAPPDQPRLGRALAGVYLWGGIRRGLGAAWVTLSRKFYRRGAVKIRITLSFWARRSWHTRLTGCAGTLLSRH
jgi:hypothetical protein